MGLTEGTSIDEESRAHLYVRLSMGECHCLEFHKFSIASSFFLNEGTFAMSYDLLIINLCINPQLNFCIQTLKWFIRKKNYKMLFCCIFFFELVLTLFSWK